MAGCVIGTAQTPGTTLTRPKLLQAIIRQRRSESIGNSYMESKQHKPRMTALGLLQAWDDAAPVSACARYVLQSVSLLHKNYIR